MSSRPLQCTRCKHEHTDDQLVSRPRKARSAVSIEVSDLVCPRCGCKTSYDLTPQVAWCWASGLIEIGDAMPADGPDGGGAIRIAQGPKAFLKPRLEVFARHGYGASDGRLLVPGGPEATTQVAKAVALAAWLARCGMSAAARRDRIEFDKELEQP